VNVLANHAALLGRVVELESLKARPSYMDYRGEFNLCQSNGVEAHVWWSAGKDGPFASYFSPSLSVIESYTYRSRY